MQCRLGWIFLTIGGVNIAKLIYWLVPPFSHFYTLNCKLSVFVSCVYFAAAGETCGNNLNGNYYGRCMTGLFCVVNSLPRICAPEYYETIINEFKQLLMQLKQLGDYCGYGLIHADGNMHCMGICKPGLYCDNEKQRCKREGNYISYTDWWWWSCIILIIQTKFH